MRKNTSTKTTRLLRSAIIAIGCAAVAAPALGQGGMLDPNAQPNQQPVRRDQAAPQPVVRKTYPTWVGYVVMFLMVAAIVPLSLIPSKRSHQD